MDEIFIFLGILDVHEIFIFLGILDVHETARRTGWKYGTGGGGHDVCFRVPPGAADAPRFLPSYVVVPEKRGEERDGHTSRGKVDLTS